MDRRILKFVGLGLLAVVTIGVVIYVALTVGLVDNPNPFSSVNRR